ncbi:MAG: transcription termination/antitermination protein NusG [Anaeroplasma sp.]|uniref:transcription termination/antitermination protein NusG n=1 Tax=Anaeroplasma sp. TaxID=1872523 RepID=UPI002A91DAF1|nr:transcription termination/antitermination protein NusG [Anaeroplasma sp.]MDY5982254.1 transcription termination/antitermination protein NusG [Anaeroplasma sp.]
MKRWYIVTTYSGYENSVKQDLERRRESMNMTHLIYQVLVPEEVKEVVDKKGKKKEKVEKLFPGYVFVEMEVDKEMDEDAWFMVRNTPKVTGFLGSSGGGTKPVAVPKDEMDAILEKLGLVQKPVFEIYAGDKVIVTEGSFKDMVGEVSIVNLEKETLTILINMFGRMTPMEFPFNQVKKI